MGVFSTLSGKYLSEIGLFIIGISKKDNPINISWIVADISAFIGTYSHVVLDAIMHSDVQPYHPYSIENDFLGIISGNDLHHLCLYTAGIGTILYLLIQFTLKNKMKSYVSRLR